MLNILYCKYKYKISLWLKIQIMMLKVLQEFPSKSNWKFRCGGGGTKTCFKTCFFKLWPCYGEHLFWPPSMVYISVINTKILWITFLHNIDHLWAALSWLGLFQDLCSSGTKLYSLTLLREHANSYAQGLGVAYQPYAALNP